MRMCSTNCLVVSNVGPCGWSYRSNETYKRNKFFFHSWGEVKGCLSFETHFVKVNNIPLVEDEMMVVICFLSSNPSTWMFFPCFCFACLITSHGHKMHSNLIFVDYQTSKNIVCFDKVNNHVCRGYPFLLPCFW